MPGAAKQLCVPSPRSEPPVPDMTHLPVESFRSRGLCRVPGRALIVPWELTLFQRGWHGLAAHCSYDVRALDHGMQILDDHRQSGRPSCQLRDRGQCSATSPNQSEHFADSDVIKLAGELDLTSDATIHTVDQRGN